MAFFHFHPTQNSQNTMELGHSECDRVKTFVITVELQWLEQLWDLENEFETGVVQANEG